MGYFNVPELTKIKPVTLKREGEKKKKSKPSPAGFEPATSGLEVQRAIHCATGTYAKEDHK